MILDLEIPWIMNSLTRRVRAFEATVIGTFWIGEKPTKPFMPLTGKSNTSQNWLYLTSLRNSWHVNNTRFEDHWHSDEPIQVKLLKWAIKAVKRWQIGQSSNLNSSTVVEWSASIVNYAPWYITYSVGVNEYISSIYISSFFLLWKADQKTQESRV